MKKLFLIATMLLSTLSLAEVKVSKMPEVKFTGYKFLEKVGVSGTFRSISWDYPANAKNVKQLIEETSARIDSYSIDANVEARNINITEALFKNWGGRYIKVDLNSYNASAKTAKADITVGDKKNTTIFQVHQLKNKLIFTSSIDVLEMGFGNSFSKLAKRCSDWHTGSDGVTKTWSTVDLEVKVALAK